MGKNLEKGLNCPLAKECEILREGRCYLQNRYKGSLSEDYCRRGCVMTDRLEPTVEIRRYRDDNLT